MNSTVPRAHPVNARWPHRFWAAALVALATPALAFAQLPKQDVIDVPAVSTGLCVSNLFQSNMVLQRDKPIQIWGWAAPGEEVTVALGASTGVATADRHRHWHITLPAQPANATPQALSIRSATESLSLDNVLLGDVWILGGQSNMEFELAKVENGELEIASANYPELRILTVPYAEGHQAHQSFPRLHEWSDWFGRHFRKGDWDVCTPDVARELSAIGYVFARRVHMASKVPIGVIDASRGGTTVQTWTPRAALDAMDSPALSANLTDWDQRVSAWDSKADLERRVQRHHQWLERMRKEERPVPDDRRADPTNLLPGPSADHNFPGACFAGMLKPLAGLSVKGVIFHQGYNNALDGMPGVRLYRDVLPEMIRVWREALGDPALPFGLISLCTDGYPQTSDDYVSKMLNAGVHIRAAQYEVYRSLVEGGDDNIGFASTYDLRRRWYHPQRKLPAGERIARWALATQYGLGRRLSWKPPALEELTVEVGALRLRLDTDVSDPGDGAIEGFAIAGADRRFQPAEAAYVQTGEDDRGRPRYDRKQLLLTSPLVQEPLHFRYAWARNPLGNLQATGHKDLPFATQRSDNWDMGAWPADVLESPLDGKLTRAQRNAVLAELRAEDLRRRLAEAQALIDAHAEGGLPK